MSDSDSHGRGSPQRTAVRSARLLTAFDLDAVASAVDIPQRLLLQALKATASRGVCADIAARVFAAGRVSERAAAAAHRGCSPPMARRASSDSSPQVRAAVVGVAAWPGRAADHPAAHRRAAAGANAGRRVPVRTRGCPPALCVGLARHAHPKVRAAVSINPNCPAASLLRLAQDDDRHVRWGVAANTNSPPQKLTLLAQDTSERVRAAIAGHNTCPPETLTQLAQDADRHVREPAAANAACPPETLARLAQDKDRYVRYRVAANPNSPPQKLALLAQDKALGTRYRVALRSDCPPLVLQQLAADPDPLVSATAADNPACPATPATSSSFA